MIFKELKKLYLHIRNTDKRRLKICSNEYIETYTDFQVQRIQSLVLIWNKHLCVNVHAEKLQGCHN
jgi:hypothetical protein